MEATIVDSTSGTSLTFAEVLTDENAFKSGETYVIQTMGSADGVISTADSDAAIIAAAFTDTNGAQLSGTLAIEAQKLRWRQSEILLVAQQSLRNIWMQLMR